MQNSFRNSRLSLGSSSFSNCPRGQFRLVALRETALWEPEILQDTRHITHSESLNSSDPSSFFCDTSTFTDAALSGTLPREPVKDLPELKRELFSQAFFNESFEDTREAWRIQRIQDGENYAALARQFWEDWNQELVNIADLYSNDIREEAKRNLRALEPQLEASNAAELEEFLNALTARQQQTSLSELQAVPMGEADAELFAELSEFSQLMPSAERTLEDLESLKPSYAAPNSARPYKPIVYNDYSPPLKRAPKGGSGYTIGPEGTVEFGGGDSGDGSGGDWDGSDGGGDFDGSDGGGDGGYNFFVLILFGSGVIVIGRVIGRVIGDYGYKILSSGIEKYLQVTQKELDQLQAAEHGGIEPRKRAKLKAALPSLVPVLLSGSALAVLSYVLHPERLRELVALLADVIAILAQELGRVLLQLIPPQLQELAQRVGQAIEFIAAYARLLVEQVVIPVLFYVRTFGIWFLSAFLVLKLVTLGAELYQLLAASGIAKNINLPPSVVAKAQEVAELISGTAADASPSLFLSQFLKAISLLVLGLVPAPDFSPDPLWSPKLAKLFKLSVIVGVYSLVLGDTRHISQLAGWALQASPELNSMVSCVAGRWCLIIIIGNLVRRESALKNYSLPFACMLYCLRVYQLAFSASPNFLPINYN